MRKQELIETIRKKRSFLCVGLDSDFEKIPGFLKSMDDPVFEFNKRIIDATLPFAVAYKPNLAFYESLGSKGLESLEKTIQYLNSQDEKVFTIADAKRGDIGNTASHYAKAFFEELQFDSLTVNPYMGMDSVSPYLKFKNKWVILLAITSNKGATDFQLFPQYSPGLLEMLGIKTCSNEKKLFEEVVEKSVAFAGSDRLMFVVGATQTDRIKTIRELAPDYFFLVPGVGVQGGSLEEVCEHGMNQECGLIVNASRSIIFASQGKDFDKAAASEAQSIQKTMESLLRQKGIVS